VTGWRLRAPAAGEALPVGGYFGPARPGAARRGCGAASNWVKLGEKAKIHHRHPDSISTRGRSRRPTRTPDSHRTFAFVEVSAGVAMTGTPAHSGMLNQKGPGPRTAGKEGRAARVGKPCKKWASPLASAATRRA
jgi:hypothetical protein